MFEGPSLVRVFWCHHFNHSAIRWHQTDPTQCRTSRSVPNDNGTKILSHSSIFGSHEFGTICYLRSCFNEGSVHFWFSSIMAFVLNGLSYMHLSDGAFTLNSPLLDNAYDVIFISLRDKIPWTVPANFSNNYHVFSLGVYQVFQNRITYIIVEVYNIAKFFIAYPLKDEAIFFP